MMTDGGSAFPVPSDTLIDANGAHTYLNDYGCGPKPGMSLRDWFAGQALSGVWAGRESDFVKISSPTTDDVAVACYSIADAMLKARENRYGG